MANEDYLAYGDVPPEGGERGLIGDTFKKLRGDGSGGSGSLFSSVFNKVHETVHGIGTEVTSRLAGEKHSHTHAGQCSDGTHDSPHRYDSFAAERDGNDVKWFVDGCGYMWAVSRALEQARESIWILDCWSSTKLCVTTG